MSVMTLGTMEKSFKLLEKVPRKSYMYMRIKNYVDVIFQNFNYETMKKDEARKGLEIIVESVRIFYEMRNFGGTREKEEPKEKVSFLANIKMPSWN